MKYATVDLLIWHVLDDVQVPPWWIAGNYLCWEMIVDQWCSQAWIEAHEATRERRLRMPGAPHHQGNRHLGEFSSRWVREFIILL